MASGGINRNLSFGFRFVRLYQIRTASSRCLTRCLSTSFDKARLKCDNITHSSRFVHTSAVLKKKIDFNLSDIGEGIREVQIKEWFVKVGDPVTQFERICEVQSDKASVEITSRFDGIITKLYYNIDDVAETGKPLVEIDTSDLVEGAFEEDNKVEDSSTSSSSSSSDSDDSMIQKQRGKKVMATPAVRRLAMENKILLSDVPATGKDGRVLKEDILRYLDQKSSPETPLMREPSTSVIEPMRTVPIPTPLKIPEKIETRQVLQKDRTEQIKGIRKAMVKTMTAAQKIPPFGYYDEIDVTNLVKLRTDVKDAAFARGIKFSYMPVFIKVGKKGLQWWL